MSDGCARLLEVARGLRVQVSSCRDTSNRKGHFLGIIHSKMFGVFTGKKKNLCELACRAYAGSEFF